MSGKTFLDTNIVIPVMPDTIARALALARKYRYSYYDSLILAAALSAGCDTLATEDMLKIHCPFVKQ